MTCLSNNKMNGWMCEKHPKHEFLHEVGYTSETIPHLVDGSGPCSFPGTRCLCMRCDPEGTYANLEYYYRIYNGKPS